MCQIACVVCLTVFVSTVLEQQHCLFRDLSGAHVIRNMNQRRRMTATSAGHNLISLLIWVNCPHVLKKIHQKIVLPLLATWILRGAYRIYIAKVRTHFLQPRRHFRVHISPTSCKLNTRWRSILFIGGKLRHSALELDLSNRPTHIYGEHVCGMWW